MVTRGVDRVRVIRTNITRPNVEGLIKEKIKKKKTDEHYPVEQFFSSNILDIVDIIYNFREVITICEEIENEILFRITPLKRIA